MVTDDVRELKDKTAVVGVGTSKFGRNTGLSATTLVLDAVVDALNDSGLDKSAVDGLIVCGGPECDRLPELLGMNVRYGAQTWSHGRMSGVAIQWASLIVNAGLANYVLCSYSTSSERFRSGLGAPGSEATRPGGGPHLEYPEYGMMHPGALAAMSMRRYMHMYGVKSDDLGTIAVTQRQHAALNPNAVYRNPITMKDYLNARLVIEPLRLFDFAAVNDGAVAVIVTTAERARDCRKSPAYVTGMSGMNTGRQYVVFAREGLGAGRQDVFDYRAPESMRVFEMAGVTQKDIDVVQVYDSFSPEVPFGLEEYGFCPTGEAVAWMQGGRTALGGELPVNTSGGHLSEAMLGGWGHLAEAIRQARGDCGERQVKDAEISQYVFSPGLSLIFTRK